jgi:hypothetical protein
MSELAGMRKGLRLLFFAAALCAMATGLLAGLGRLGFNLPAATLVGQHGPLMVCGLFGTLIRLERAVAMAKPWPYLAPGLSALGVILLLGGAPHGWSVTPFIAAAAVLTLASFKLWNGQKVQHLAVLALAALMWLVGNVVWWHSGFAQPADHCRRAPRAVALPADPSSGPASVCGAGRAADRCCLAGADAAVCAGVDCTRELAVSP